MDEPSVSVSFVPEPLPPSRFADPAQARHALPLGFAVVDEAGKTWREIHIRRFSVDQVAAVIRNWIGAQKVDPDAPLAFPSFVDADMVEVPRAVMGLLEDDDMQAVQKAARDFLPRRFRPDPEPETNPALSGPSTGDTTGPSSAA